MSTSRSTPAQLLSTSCPKAVVSVSEMARMVGLSRSRFYALIEEGVFPGPVYLVRTRRPVFTVELQSACLEVRQRGIGFATGEPVMFNGKRGPAMGRPSTSSARNTRASVKSETSVDPGIARLLDGLKQLGRTDVKPAEAIRAIAERFPDGVAGVESGAVLAAVFRHLRASR